MLLTYGIPSDFRGGVDVCCVVGRFDRNMTKLMFRSTEGRLGARGQKKKKKKLAGDTFKKQKSEHGVEMRVGFEVRVHSVLLVSTVVNVS